MRKADFKFHQTDTKIDIILSEDNRYIAKVTCDTTEEAETIAQRWRDGSWNLLID